MNRIEEYYNKFNEDKRLKSRHGQVEFAVTMAKIKERLEYFMREGRGKEDVRIADIGAGCGAYSIPLCNEGYDVTAVELVKHNLGVMKKNCPHLKAYQGNAMDLKKLGDDSFDLVLMFGPLYHLYSNDDKIKALREAARIVKKSGVIMVAYTMNEYSILTYGFKEGHICECLENGSIDKDFHVRASEENLYDYVTLSDIDALNEAAGLRRMSIFSPDGAADYMRICLNAMDEETFALFIDYQMSVCMRTDLIGAGSHTVDVLAADKA